MSTIYDMFGETMTDAEIFAHMNAQERSGVSVETAIARLTKREERNKRSTDRGRNY